MHEWHQPALCKAVAATKQIGPCWNCLPLYQDMLRHSKSKCSMMMEDHLLALDSDPANQKPGVIAEGHLPV